MNTALLPRIGAALLGGGILLVNVVHAVSAVGSEAAPVRATVIVSGLVAGAVLVAGARAGSADRRREGARMALAGAALLWAGAVSVALSDSPETVRNLYMILVIGPPGLFLGVALLAIGIVVLPRDRLGGLCMIAPGIGFMPSVAHAMIFSALGYAAAGAVPVWEIGSHGGTAVGAALLALGIAMARRGSAGGGPASPIRAPSPPWPSP